jgi:hypothetical protein
MYSPHYDSALQRSGVCVVESRGKFSTGLVVLRLRDIVMKDEGNVDVLEVDVSFYSVSASRLGTL